MDSTLQAINQDASFIKIEIFCDGFCWKNPAGSMGTAAILTCDAKILELFEGFPAAAENTNNRSELLAAILGLRALIKPSPATILTDSQYLVRGWSTWERGARRERINADLWNQFDRTAGAHALSIEWRAGYDPGIARADKVARDAAIPHLSSKVTEAIYAWEEADAQGKKPGPLYHWLLRREGRVS
jgi:ribonuclease HI